MNHYILKFSADAEQMLETMYQYIRNEATSIEAARKWLSELREACSGLTLFPSRYPLVSRNPWKALGLRKRPLGNYIIYYRILDDVKEVHVVAITHSRQNQWRALTDFHME